MLHRPLRRHPSVACCWAVLLCACSITGIRREETEIAGPPLATGQPTRQVHRCDIATAHSPWASTGNFNRCDVAFRGGNGVHIDAFGVQRDISAALPRALPLRPLLEQFRNSAVSSKGSVDRYTLYVVAVNPTVVVGVPNKRGDSSCFAPGWTKCFTAVENYQQDQRYAARSSFTVYYNTRPPVRDGSFVLVPEWNNPSTPLPSENPTATFVEKATSITLEQRDGTWRVSGAGP